LATEGPAAAFEAAEAAAGLEAAEDLMKDAGFSDDFPTPE